MFDKKNPIIHLDPEGTRKIRTFQIDYQMHANIISTGMYLPNKAIANSELSQFPPNALHLIKEKTGIEHRHYATAGQNTSDLGIEACRDCLMKVDVKKIDYLICSTSTPDRIIPATATKIANALGLKGCFAFDVNSVCSGSCALLDLARAYILSESAKNVLVVAADTYSRILNPRDFSTYPYFGDGAAAALISGEKEGFAEICGGVFHSDGNGYETITVKAGGSEIPSYALEKREDAYFSMNGRAVYEFACSVASSAIEECLDKFLLKSEDINLVLAHQANINILKSISEKTEINFSKFFKNLQKYGNTASASVLLALADFVSQNCGTVPKSIILTSFGGGLSWGALYVKGTNKIL